MHGGDDMKEKYMILCVAGQSNAVGYDESPVTEAFFRFFGGRYPGRMYKGDWNRSIWYNHETVAYWCGLEGCRAIWENHRRWSPETYVAIPRDTDANEVNGTGITARVRAHHFGNDTFERVVAPRVARAMAKRLVP